MKRHIITKLNLREISAVDRPAQSGALMTIMKHDRSTNGDQMELLISEVAKREGCSRSAAMAIIAVQNPEAVSAMRKRAEDRLEKRASGLKAQVPAKLPDAAEKLIADIMARDGITRSRAMEKAVADKPDMFRNAK